mmetsp:Transcript_3005/g.9225  ORF Transcript_3005/g.9225 Transcript_3005/m.9225 type:complete len:333 (-) Transcript_3005:429-1427(-)
MTITLVESMTVCRRCAIVITVRPPNSSRTVCWIIASVRMSTAAVASSIKMIWLFLSSARAMHSSCRCPTLQLPPPSATGASSAATADARWARCSAAHTSASEWRSKGSRLSRTVPLNRTGSCGMTATLPRRSSRPISPTFTPSTRTAPRSTSTQRVSTYSSDDLPAPVRPTTPIFSPLWMVKSSPRSTCGSSGRYRIHTSTTVIAPRDGHEGGGRRALITAGASCSTSAYCSTLSTDTAFVSSSEAMRTVQFSDCVTDSANAMDRPASPGKDSGMSGPCCATASAAAPVTMQVPANSRRRASQQLVAKVRRYARWFWSRRKKLARRKRRQAS